MERRPMIRVENLRKIYRVGDERVVALDNINLEIMQGQIVCVVGPSGSGKSTLLNQLAGLEKPTRGAVYIGKTNISALREDQLAIFRQRYLGFVFQSYNLLPTFTALENVALPLIFRGESRAKRNKTALSMLGAVGLRKRAGHKPTQMSGGQQQRVGIARAFVTKPKVVFADEPTGNLDTKTTVKVMETMVRFARKYNQTLVLVTHDPELADYADRVITFVDGNVKSDVTQTPKVEVSIEKKSEKEQEQAEEAAVEAEAAANADAEQPQEKDNGPSLADAFKTPPLIRAGRGGLSAVIETVPPEADDPPDDIDLEWTEETNDTPGDDTAQQRTQPTLAAPAMPLPKDLQLPDDPQGANEEDKGETTNEA